MVQVMDLLVHMMTAGPHICMKMIDTVVVRQLAKTSGWGIQIPSKYKIFGKVKLGRKNCVAVMLQ